MNHIDESTRRAILNASETFARARDAILEHAERHQSVLDEAARGYNTLFATLPTKSNLLAALQPYPFAAALRGITSVSVPEPRRAPRPKRTPPSPSSARGRAHPRAPATDHRERQAAAERRAVVLHETLTGRADPTTVGQRMRGDFVWRPAAD